MSMRVKLTREENFLNRLALHSLDAPDRIGLLTGQMGIIVVLAQYARKKHKPEVEEIADVLYDNVIKRVATMRDISFASGLSGICWGIEYLVQHGILEGPAEEICKDADAVIAEADITKMKSQTLESGTYGLWQYVWARLQGNLMAGLPLPFSSEYLQSWELYIRENASLFPQGEADRLTLAMNGELQYRELSPKPFVSDMKELLLNDVTLQKGVAGYIELKYLSDD